MTSGSPGQDRPAEDQDPVVEAATEGAATEGNEDPAAPDAPASGSARDRGTSDVAELEDSLEHREESDSEGEEAPAVSREVQLSAQIERLQSEADANRDKWLRAVAELDNFRKRSRREFETSINLARADVLKQLLEVLDNFERALDAFDQAEEAPGETFVKGVRLIQDQLMKILRDHEVSKIEAVGEPFDPNLHEAISQMETDEVPSHHVARVVKEGYRLNDMVLRPAMVVVAQ